MFTPTMFSRRRDKVIPLMCLDLPRVALLYTIAEVLRPSNVEHLSNLPRAGPNFPDSSFREPAGRDPTVYIYMCTFICVYIHIHNCRITVFAILYYIILYIILYYIMLYYIIYYIILYYIISESRPGTAPASPPGPTITIVIIFCLYITCIYNYIYIYIYVYIYIYI